MSLLEQYADGAAIIREWLGAGGAPVPQMQAEARAHTCVGCAENVAPRWWERAVNEIAETIRQHLEIKHRVDLKVTADDALHMCRKCGCCLQLKVHTPIAHIADHTEPELVERLPDFCWMKRELKEYYELHHA